MQVGRDDITLLLCVVLINVSVHTKQRRQRSKDLVLGVIGHQQYLATAVLWVALPLNVTRFLQTVDQDSRGSCAHTEQGRQIGGSKLSSTNKMFQGRHIVEPETQLTSHVALQIIETVQNRPQGVCQGTGARRAARALPIVP